MENCKPVLLFSLLITFSLSLSVKGQADFRPGYMITLKGDTVKGSINLRTDKTNSTECIFKKDGDEEIKAYSPGEITSYRFIDGKYYISANSLDSLIDKNVFLEYLIRGTMSILYYPDDVKDHYFVMMDNRIIELDHNNRLTGRADEDVLLKANPENFKGQLKYLTKDQPAMTGRIDKTNCYSKDLITLTKEYQKLSCPGEECIQYEKGTKGNAKLKFAIHTGAGISYHSSASTNLELSDYEPSKFLDIKPAFIYEAGVSFNLYVDYTGRRRYCFQFVPAINIGNYESYEVRVMDFLLYRYDVNIRYTTLNFPVLLKYSLYSSSWPMIPFFKLGIGYSVYYQKGNYVYSSLPVSGSESQAIFHTIPFDHKAPNRLFLIAGVGTDIKWGNRMLSLGAVFSYGECQLRGFRSDTQLQIDFQL
jgi:hypothetical protein